MNVVHGILPIYKPSGCTSFDVVGQMRRMLGQKKIGHSGTLDPMVEGILPICIGKATRVVEYLQDLPKRYKGSFILGRATDTEDITGSIVEEAPVKDVSLQQLHDVFQSFHGTIYQTPPMYSAVKVDGKRLYEYARKGENVSRSKRCVNIYELSLINMERIEGVLTVHFDVLCSKGTYIRTLCVDIGKALGYPACMSSLLRTQSGPFHIEDCYTIEEIGLLIEKQELSKEVTQMGDVLSHFPSLIVSAEDAQSIKNGCKISWDHDREYEGIYRILSEEDGFIALYCYERTLDLAKPIKVFWGA